MTACHRNNLRLINHSRILSLILQYLSSISRVNIINVGYYRIDKKKTRFLLRLKDWVNQTMSTTNNALNGSYDRLIELNLKFSSHKHRLEKLPMLNLIISTSAEFYRLDIHNQLPRKLKYPDSHANIRNRSREAIHSLRKRRTFLTLCSLIAIFLWTKLLCWNHFQVPLFPRHLARTGNCPNVGVDNQTPFWKR